MRQLEFEDEGRDEAYRKFIRDHPHPLHLLLDGITDPRNLGALLRLADAARLSGIILLHEEPVELPNSAKRASRSTWKHIPFQQFRSPVELPERIRQANWVALERTDESRIFWNNLPPSPTVLLLGHESEGIRQDLLDRCDYAVHLPMLGWNTSMNVAMAAGIAVYEWLRGRE